MRICGSMTCIHSLGHSSFNWVLFWRVRDPSTSSCSPPPPGHPLIIPLWLSVLWGHRTQDRFVTTTLSSVWLSAKSYRLTLLGLRYKCRLWRCAHPEAVSLRQTQIWCFRPSQEHPPWAHFLPAVLCLKRKHQIHLLITSISKTSSQHTLSICVDHSKRRKITVPLSQLYSLMKTVRWIWRLQKNLVERMFDDTRLLFFSPF